VEKKAIEFLAEYRVSKLEFDALNELVRVAIATSAYAYSESNVFARIYIFSDHDYEGEKAIEAMIQIQRFTLLRTWSAKLLEYHNFLRELRKLAIDDCEPLLKFLDGNLPKFNELKKMAGYETIRSLRNKVINHLDPSFILANLDHIDEHADLSLHIHEKEGNSFSPVGEHVVFFHHSLKAGTRRTSRKRCCSKTGWIGIWRQIGCFEIRTLSFGCSLLSIRCRINLHLRETIGYQQIWWLT